MIILWNIQILRNECIKTLTNKAIFYFQVFYGSMDNISFKSNIRLATPEEFKRITGCIGKKYSVNYPWTIKQSLLSESAYTTDILDCTVCGITDGQKVLLNHICPTISDNNNFQRIADFIKNKINIKNEYLQGFILGSKQNSKSSPNSTALFDNFVNLMNELKIPFSKFKGGDYVNNVAYSSTRDEWLISNQLINEDAKKNYKNNPIEMFKKIFDEISISKLDDISL